MPAVVLIGSQWGDEGKGRIIDLLAEQADFVVRFQGGNNAGHTLYDSNGNKVVVHLIPSGILYPEKTCVVGNGVVVDPEQMVKEIELLEEKGYLKKASQLRLSDSCHLVMPYHKVFDRLEEEARGKHKIGTTGRGIGPAYMDKVGRNGLRMSDLLDEKRFLARLDAVLPIKQQMLSKCFGKDPLDRDQIIATYLEFGKKLKPYVAQTPALLYRALADNKRVLLEGAQGIELDVDHGTYPFVTSSNTLAGAACVGAGIAPKSIDKVIAITKAYTTRVGSGPFPTEDHGKDGDTLGERGNEFGATTGRKRRCGWLDAVQTRHAFHLNGIDSVILTKFDVLSGFDEVKIATHYEVNGQKTSEMPSGAENLEHVSPIYETLAGWPKLEKSIQSIDDLSDNALTFIARFEKLTGAKVDLISVGPERQDFICRQNQSLSLF